MTTHSNKAPGATPRRRALAPRLSGIARLIVLAVLVTSIAGQARADDGLFAGVKTLNADQLVELVQSRNADLESARAAADEAATRIKPAGALDDPMLSYSIAPRTVGSDDLGTRQSYEVSQSIPWPGTLSARATKARAEASAAQNDSDMRLLGVIADTKAAFAEWSYIHAALRVNQQHQHHLQAIKMATERSYAAGVGREQDALKASLELVRMENAALMLESQRRAIKARINALLDREPDADLPAPASAKLFSRLPSFDQLETVTLARQPELKGLQAGLDASDAGVSLARKAFYPDLNVKAGYDEMWDNEKQRPVVGVSINIPLNWGRREAELAGAHAARRKAEWKLADRKATLLANLAESYASTDAAIQSVALHRDRLLPLANAGISAALADYRRGTGDFSSVIEAERSKLDQALSLERAIADAFRSLAALEQAAGGPLSSSEGPSPSPAAKGLTDHQEHHP